MIGVRRARRGFGFLFAFGFGGFGGAFGVCSVGSERDMVGITLLGAFRVVRVVVAVAVAVDMVEMRCWGICVGLRIGCYEEE